MLIFIHQFSNRDGRFFLCENTIWVHYERQNDLLLPCQAYCYCVKMFSELVRLSFLAQASFGQFRIVTMYMGIERGWKLYAICNKPVAIEIFINNSIQSKD
jgi:hypothetical protein